MKTHIIICIGILFSLSACKKEAICCTVVSTSLYLEIANADGLDLLDPNTDNNISVRNTDLYYIINGKKEKQFHGHLDIPKMFTIEKYIEDILLRVFLNTNTDKDGFSVSILEYEGYPSDTIKARVHKNHHSTYTSDTWINGKQVIDLQTKMGLSGPIKLIK